MSIIKPIMGTTTLKAKQGQPLNMADALFTRTQQNVLALLYGQPGQSLYTNEIIKKSGGGSGAVQRELSRLVRSGLVTVQRLGSQNHYNVQANAAIADPVIRAGNFSHALRMPSCIMSSSKTVKL